eukprot:gene20049-26765_t
MGGSRQSSCTSSIDRDMMSEVAAAGMSGGHGVGRGGAEASGTGGLPSGMGGDGSRQAKGSMHRDSSGHVQLRSMSGMDAQSAHSVHAQMHGGQQQQQQHRPMSNGHNHNPASMAPPHMGQESIQHNHGGVGNSRQAMVGDSRHAMVGDSSGQQGFGLHPSMIAAASAAAAAAGNGCTSKPSAANALDSPSSNRGQAPPYMGRGGPAPLSQAGPSGANGLDGGHGGHSSESGLVQGLPSYRNATTGALPLGGSLSSPHLGGVGVPSGAINGMPPTQGGGPPVPPSPTMSTPSKMDDNGRPSGGTPPGVGNLNHAAAEFNAGPHLMGLQQQQGMGFGMPTKRHLPMNQPMMDSPGLDDFAHMGLIDDLLTE